MKRHLAFSWALTIWMVAVTTLLAESESPQPSAATATSEESTNSSNAFFSGEADRL